MKESIYGLSFDHLADWVENQGEKRFRAKQIWHWLYEKRITDFQEMKNVNESCIALLDENFTIVSLDVELKQESKEGTIKFLLNLHNRQLIETGVIRLYYGLSVCVTTRVGSNICCSFCASRILRKNPDLSAGEIVEQI